MSNVDRAFAGRKFCRVGKGGRKGGYYAEKSKHGTRDAEEDEEEDRGTPAFAGAGSKIGTGLISIFLPGWSKHWIMRLSASV